MKKLLCLVMLLGGIFFVNADQALDTISTTLIVLEETENTFTELKEGYPFSDGVMDAMWEKPYIFFDMKIEKPLALYGDQLDIRPFLSDARDSGADSLLLIKFCYETEDKGDLVRIKAKNIPYALYSLKKMQLLRSGEEPVNLDESITPGNKTKRLKELGADIIEYIFK